MCSMLRRLSRCLVGNAGVSMLEQNVLKVCIAGQCVELQASLPGREKA
jgi:hypothetical protein